MKKSEKRVRFQDEVAVTGVSHKRLKTFEYQNNEKEFLDYHQSHFSTQRLKTCYTPERDKRVCPNFEPDLDFSISWAKKFLRGISM